MQPLREQIFPVMEVDLNKKTKSFLLGIAVAQLSFGTIFVNALCIRGYT